MTYTTRRSFPSSPTRPFTAQHAAPYAEALNGYAKKDWVHLNIPGHSGAPEQFPALAQLVGAAPLLLDAPPMIEGIDLEPESPLQQALVLAAEAWGARRTWFLTGGASQGNRIAVTVCKEFGNTLVVQRSVHSSVIDGLVLSGLRAAFVHPSVDSSHGIAHGVTPAELAEALADEPQAAAAFVVSPSYFGAVADIQGLANVAHAAGVPLIVDEAWGAHFGFHPELPLNALALGADMVISSTHKLGGSLQQSAMLHLADGQFADRMEPWAQRVFQMTQSTSPSSLLLGSLDVARCALVNASDQMTDSIKSAERIRSVVRSVGRFSVMSDEFEKFSDIIALDPLRIAIDTRVGGISGYQARRQLMESHQVLVELATETAILAVIGPGSAPQVDRFLEALHNLEENSAPSAEPIQLPLPPSGPVRMTSREAFLARSRTVPASHAVGHISADALSAYPPGIPNVLPGEVITTEAIEFLQGTAATPTGYVRGAVDPTLTYFRIVDE